MFEDLCGLDKRTRPFTAYCSIHRFVSLYIYNIYISYFILVANHLCVCFPVSISHSFGSKRWIAFLWKSHSAVALPCGAVPCFPWLLCQYQLLCNERRPWQYRAIQEMVKRKATGTGIEMRKQTNSRTRQRRLRLPCLPHNVFAQCI